MGNLDEEKILIKLDQMEGYLAELNQVLPDNYEDYETIEKRRSTKRLLQLAIETVIDLCNLVVSGLDLGLPAEENDLFNKLAKEQIITERSHFSKTTQTWRRFLSATQEYSKTNGEKLNGSTRR